jgi:hypothetical protein
MPSSRLKKEDQDPRHCSIIITPLLLTPERCMAQLEQMGPQNQVTGNRVLSDGSGDQGLGLVLKNTPALLS